MGWNTTMPSGFTDGQTVDEADLDPIVENLNFVRYATVFMGGIRRTTTVPGITSTEVAVMQTPNVAFEAGYLYKIEGAYKYNSGSGTNYTLELRIHEGAGIAGAVIQSFGTPTISYNSIGYQANFSVNVKITSAVTRAYTLGVRSIAGLGTPGTHFCETTSWMSILRSGDNALMTDV